jgi:hypothetical protein
MTVEDLFPPSPVPSNASAHMIELPADPVEDARAPSPPTLPIAAVQMSPQPATDSVTRPLALPHSPVPRAESPKVSDPPAPPVETPPASPAADPDTALDQRSTVEPVDLRSPSPPPTSNTAVTSPSAGSNLMRSPSSDVKQVLPVPPSQRERYQQPKRIQILDTVDTKTVAGRMANMQKPTTSKPAPSLVQAAKDQFKIQPPAQPRSTFVPTTYVPTGPHAGPAVPQSAPPTQPRSWGIPSSSANAIPLSTTLPPKPASDQLPPPKAAYTEARATNPSHGPAAPLPMMSPNPSNMLSPSSYVYILERMLTLTVRLAHSSKYLCRLYEQSTTLRLILEGKSVLRGFRSGLTVTGEGQTPTSL